MRLQAIAASALVADTNPFLKKFPMPIATRRLFPFSVSIISVLAIAAVAGEPGSDIIRDVGDRRELFVDDWLIAAMDNVTLRLHPATPREIAVPLDDAWAGPTTGFTNVFKDGDIYRMYYSNDLYSPTGEFASCTSYAESPDGIHWTKPDLGLIEFEGSKHNNIVWKEPSIHSFSVFRDDNHAAPPEQRYKALGGTPPTIFASPDGIHWSKIQKEGVLRDGPDDSQNLAFWDPRRNEYVAFARFFLEGGIRHIRTATSTDFIHWSPSHPIDFGSAPAEELYTNAITPYFRAPHIYVGIPMRFVDARQPVKKHPYAGVSDGVLITSRDGDHFDRRFLESFIQPGIGEENWTDRTNLPCWGVVPTGENEMSVYWVEHFRHPTVALRRGSLRLDGFASVTAPPSGGEFTTWPLTFAGTGLELNFRTSAPGGIRVAVLERDGKEIPGYALTDCEEIYGNDLARKVTWSGGDLSGLSARPVRLRFVMRDADLFALRFVPSPIDPRTGRSPRTPSPSVRYAGTPR